MQLGVCWYPEQWPEAWWADDARRMRELGIAWVRIAEFAWAVIEPEPGRLEWGWLDRAIAALHAEGLKVVLGTPTATPPKWLVDKHPDMLAVDAQGRERRESQPAGPLPPPACPSLRAELCGERERSAHGGVQLPSRCVSRARTWMFRLSPSMARTCSPGGRNIETSSQRLPCARLSTTRPRRGMRRTAAASAS